jgi:hypothetical protein
VSVTAYFFAAFPLMFRNPYIFVTHHEDWLSKVLGHNAAFGYHAGTSSKFPRGIPSGLQSFAAERRPNDVNDNLADASIIKTPTLCTMASVYNHNSHRHPEFIRHHSQLKVFWDPSELENCVISTLPLKLCYLEIVPGYVRGISGLFGSPSLVRIGGTVKTITGPKLPTTIE